MADMPDKKTGSNKDLVWMQSPEVQCCCSDDKKEERLCNPQATLTWDS